MIIVHNAPGFEDFEAEIFPGLGDCPAVDSRGPLAVAMDSEGEMFAVPRRNVFTPAGLRYAREWAGKTHQSVFDIYIPEALRP
jgi:hypothetical protein